MLINIHILYYINKIDTHVKTLWDSYSRMDILIKGKLGIAQEENIYKNIQYDKYISHK